MVDDSLLTGKRLRAVVEAASRRLDANKDAVNSLNVFPVPDGDTGTNMSLTIAAALREIDKQNTAHLGEVVKALSLGSLMGARGNSGVILSQLLRGFGKSLQDKRSATPLQVAWAMQEGVDTAYRAVMKPVEGTMLTVAREVARSALVEAKRGSDLGAVLEAGLARGREVLASTPDMLPVLKQAGVVDAGGQGLVHLLEGAVEAIRGETVEGVAAASPARATQVPAGPAEYDEEIVFTYDTQLLIRGTALAVDRIRAELEPLGDSLLVVGDPLLVKVHVHTNEPHRAIGICLGHGEILEASVENMREQTDVRRRSLAAAVPDTPGQGLVAAAQRAEGPTLQVQADPMQTGTPPGAAAGGAPSVTSGADTRGPGVVAVASGKGLEEIFRNLGADVVVTGGQTMNPSTEDLLRAIESAPGREVLVLPNNGNILLAAKQAVELTDKVVRVVPTRSIPQGIAALMALNRSVDVEKNGARMEQALAGVRSGEVTQAVRDSRYKEVEIREGDFIGILDDDIVTVGPSATEVLLDLVKRMADGETEVVTVFCGADVPEDQLLTLPETLAPIVPDHVVEVHRGDQPLYQYLVSVE